MTVSLLNPSRFGGYNPKAALPWSNFAWASSAGSGLPADGQLISAWNDEGSRALNMATSGTARPTMRVSLAAMNNKPAVECDGTTDWMVSSAGSAVSVPYTMVIICNIGSIPVGAICSMMPIGVTSATRGIGYNGTSNVYRLEAGANGSGGACTTGPHAHIAYINGTSTILEVDGNVTGSYGLGGNTTNFNTFGFGARNGADFADIDVGLMGMVPRQLTNQEKLDLLTWSRSFYGTP